MKKLAIAFQLLFAVAAAVLCVLCLFEILPDNLYLECALILVFGADLFGFLKSYKAKEKQDIPIIAVIVVIALGGVIPGLFLLLHRSSLSAARTYY